MQLSALGLLCQLLNSLEFALTHSLELLSSSLFQMVIRKRISNWLSIFLFHLHGFENGHIQSTNIQNNSVLVYWTSLYHQCSQETNFVLQPPEFCLKVPCWMGVFLKQCPGVFVENLPDDHRCKSSQPGSPQVLHLAHCVANWEMKQMQVTIKTNLCADRHVWMTNIYSTRALYAEVIW